ncbi:hypothetical protein V1264_007870 [Littorina saxatilis]|uniref:Uncharacterized protein n=1 Tax=Littorina saxatilis TaxID=31220 RepID=A0AAN9G478_9CAEN
MNSSVCQWVLLVVCAFVGLSAGASVREEEGGTMLAQRLQPFQRPMTSEREMMNRVLSRILDVTYEMYKEMGASPQDLKELHHKRGVIQTCYFQAISCF